VAIGWGGGPQSPYFPADYAQQAGAAGYRICRSADELGRSQALPVLLVFEGDHHGVEGPPAETPGEPRLADLTTRSLELLNRDPDGFFLMVEGGAVDWAAHNNQPGRLIEEVVGFADAVAAVRAWIDAHGGWQDNLLVVSADHETGYLTGPAPAEGPEPACLARLPLVPRGRGQVPELRFNSRDHTNALVPLFAAGAGSERLAGRAVGLDPERGPYLDNTDIGAVLQELAVR
jgi:alkaline phosphatase